MHEYLIHAFFLALAFLSGWLCRHWRRPRRKLPTDLQRALAQTRMAQIRQGVSESHDEAFFSGITVGQAISSSRDTYSKP